MRYAHTTIMVSDIEESIEFYQAVTGLELKCKFMTDQEDKLLAFLADKDGGTEIELIQDFRQKPQHGSGISLGFAVKNIETYLEKIRSMGYKTTDIISPNIRTQFFFVNDPDGIKIQLIEQI